MGDAVEELFRLVELFAKTTATITMLATRDGSESNSSTINIPPVDSIKDAAATSHDRLNRLINDIL